MAKDKKSVLLYCDLIHTVEKMDDETAGAFFKHYLRYINDLNPKTDNIVVDLTFESVKQNLKRDLKKWEQRAENSRNNGKKGGRPPKPKKPSGLIKNPTEPEKPVTDTVTVTGNVKDKVIVYRKFAHLSISNNEVESLKEHWNINQINDILDRIQNYSKNKTYTSLYLTARNWLKRDFPIVEHKQKLTIEEEIQAEQKRLDKIKSQQ